MQTICTWSLESTGRRKDERKQNVRHLYYSLTTWILTRRCMKAQGQEYYANIPCSPLKARDCTIHQLFHLI